MKFTLILTFGGLVIAGICAASSTEENSTESLTPKERIRIALARGFRVFHSDKIEEICPGPFSAEQIVFGNQKIDESQRCLNATIDLFINKLDDNIKLEDIQNFKTGVRIVSGAVCEITDDIFRCLGEYGHVYELCYSQREITFKNKIFEIWPLIQQTVCMRNGALAAEIAELDDFRCVERSINYLLNMDLIELSESDSKHLFGNENVCQNFNDVLQRMYIKVGECSTGILEKVKEMLGFFCEGTQCRHHVPDLQCK